VIGGRAHDGQTRALSRRVCHGDVGLQGHTKVDDAHDEHQKDRQSKGQLDKALRTLTRPEAGISRWAKAFHLHSPATISTTQDRRLTQCQRGYLRAAPNLTGYVWSCT